MISKHICAVGGRTVEQFLPGPHRFLLTEVENISPRGVFEVYRM